MTVQKAIEHFKEHQKASLKRRTQEGYKNLLERFQIEFFDREVESIKAEELCRFLETCTEGLARSTRRLRYAQLRAIFNFIIDTFEMNIKNPCCVPQLFKSFKNVQQRPHRILDKETVDEIIFNSASTRDLAMDTGLRLTNLCELKWSEINLFGMMITIDADAMKNDDYLGIPLTDRAYQILKELQKTPCLSGYVFHDEGRKLYDRKVQRSFKKVLKKAGISNFHFHDLRHTFASYLRQNGVDLHTISKLLGHKDLRMTKRYAHLNVDSLRSTIAKLNFTFSSRFGENVQAENV